MSEKFVNKVNKPIKKMTQKRRDAMTRMGFGDTGKIKEAGKLAGWSALQALYWTLKYTLLNNRALRWGEEKLEYINIENKKGKRNWFKAMQRRYPNISAHIWYYIIMSAIIYGGVKTFDNSMPDEEKDKKENIKESKQSIDSFVINPMAGDEDWSKQLDAVHPYVLSHVISSEGYIKDAYYDNGSGGTITFGSGFTIADKRHREFARKILGRPVGNGSHITIEENRKVVSAWLYKEVYPKIKKNFTVSLDARLFEILAVAAYNRGESTYDKETNSGWTVRQAVNDGKSAEEIAKAFVYSFAGIKGTRWGGLPNKYGVAALYYLRNISNETLLNAIAEAPYTIEAHIKKEPYNGRLLKYESDDKRARASGVYEIDNIEDLMLKTKHRITKGTKQQPVKKYMTTAQVETIMKGQLFASASFDMEDYVAPAQQALSPSEDLNYQGETLFFESDYTGAVKKFEASLKADPKNYIAYSNLSIAYYRQSNYKQGLKVVQDLLSSSYAKEIPSDVKSYTYYNAALCREALGNLATNLEEKLDHYKKSKENVLLAEKFRDMEYNAFIKRIQQKIDTTEYAIKSKSKNVKGIKKMSFNSAGRKVQSKSVNNSAKTLYMQEMLAEKRSIG